VSQGSPTGTFRRVSVARTNAARVRSLPLDTTRRLAVVALYLAAGQVRISLAAFLAVDVTLGRIKAYRAR
jgi:hypothetical protein